MRLALSARPLKWGRSMSKSTLFGRRIHIAGSVSEDVSVATEAIVREAREFVELLVAELVDRGATFVVPVDDEKTRGTDDLPICFDWLVWKVLAECAGRRPPNATTPFAVAVRHHKNEGQVPPEMAALWQRMRDSEHVEIRDVGHWNMQAKRMDAQAERGDILIAIGGGDGVLYLANRYHDAGKPVVPLNAPVTPKGSGARRLFDDIGMAQFHANRLFRPTNKRTAHEWLATVDFGNTGLTTERRVAKVVDLLEELELPQAFAVRLMDKEHTDWVGVDDTFREVILPVVEQEKGHKVVVVDGSQPFDQPTIEREIFEKLHRAQLVLADLTGLRPNCLVELGYALGRGLPTLVSARAGEQMPFDIRGVPIYFWRPNDSVEDRQAGFRRYWDANIRRPPLVPTEGLVE